MKLSEFNYDLPKDLIAQTPIEPRDESRLMIVDKNNQQIEDKIFKDILNYLWENDVIVINKTRVINARLKWKIESNNWKHMECEIFLHKQISDNTWDCLIYPWKKLKPWTKIDFDLSIPSNIEIWLEWEPWKEKKWGLDINLKANIKQISSSWRIVEFNIWWKEFLDIIDNIGQIPLPPYIKEKLENKERYQTVFNEVSWSVAAPTAWLHFTDELIEKLEKSGVIIEKVLLHVWIWTFTWVEVDDIKEHKMHSEYIEIDKEVSDRLNKFKKEKKRIIAVWTTSVRTLESFSNENWILWYWKKETDIFIYPGYKWRFVNSIITNFHLPKSTLLMLVSSFTSREKIKKAYNHAISKKYRFFSFWDAMWIK